MNHYRFTVEHLSSDNAPLQFEVANHDDIVAIALRTPVRFNLSEDETRALVVGFKLFGEVVLNNWKELPFSEIRPAMQEFAKALKQSGRGEESRKL